ncbi:MULTISPECIES: hypothetical protein [Burkholderia]|uniref:hypothetical protein n=1 Tax=Burkholderia TaxID=32008 RepID=UPI00158CFB6B|nr:MULTISPECIES: hypothetical protein [Burkholderia]
MGYTDRLIPKLLQPAGQQDHLTWPVSSPRLMKSTSLSAQYRDHPASPSKLSAAQRRQLISPLQVVERQTIPDAISVLAS